MKKIIALLSILLTVTSFAAQVKDARVVGDKLLVDVMYGGGCGEHLFDIEIGGCFETFPVSCTAELVHVTEDFCEALISTTIEFSLDELGLNDRYFERANITILGEQDWMTREKSKATVTLK